MKLNRHHILPLSKSQDHTVQPEGDAFLSNLSIGVVVLDPQGRMRELNSTVLRDIGLSEHPEPGIPIERLMGLFHDQTNLWPELLGRIARGERLIELSENNFISCREGTKRFYIQGQILSDPHYGRPDMVLFFYRSVEEELTQGYLLRMVLSQAEIYPWFFNLEQNRMVIDERWFEHLGYPKRESMLVEEFAAIVHPDERGGLMEALGNQIEGHLDEDMYQYRLLRADGTWEWFQERSAYLGRVDNAPYRIVGVCQSIQSYKTTEAVLAAARDKAEENDRLKSAFLANMSHEIRTPLNAVVGFSQLIASEEELPGDEKAEYSRLIQTNSDQLLMLISDIVDLAKIESNTMEYHFDSVVLTPLLEETLRMQQLPIKPGVELRAEWPGEETTLRTDPMRVRQVVTNLLNNAAKFTERGSITLGYRKSAQGVEIYVRDTGIGIEAEKQEQIFDRFYKGDTFVSGAGLGLSICKTIAESLGGLLVVESEVGKGSTFRLCLPLSPPAAT